MDNLEALVEISRFYGANPEFVLAGGGNTSWKDKDTLYVKASGLSLAQALPDSFVKMDRRGLAKIWEKKYPQAGNGDPFERQRESEVLIDMLAARKPGEEQRPSVEALLHDLLPFAFVVHLHPALVNGLTCSQGGEAAMKDVFGADAIWIPQANPGYMLAKLVKTAMDEYKEKCGKAASVIFLQNHGVFVGADSIDGIKEQYGEIISKIGGKITRKPDFSGLAIEPASVAAGLAGGMAQTLTKLSGAAVVFMSGGEIHALVENRASFEPVSSAFTPDHIVYAGSDPLFVQAQTDTGFSEAWNNHLEKTGRKPKIAAVQGLGVFGAAATEKAACLALDLFRDSVKVAAYSESFGGPRFMAQDKIDFINNWEAERFRSGVSTK
jgi:rhamnose utilization protein RhaD (predicted bifunctional aldolase and dehydrogenase)